MASTSPSWSALLAGGLRPKLIHVIPNFHNPAGCTLSLEKRERLVALAAEHDFLIFEDDPYGELSFEGERLPTMLSLDSNDHVVFASSFSKTIAPGVRIGYLIGPAPLIAQITTLAVNTYISPNMLAESIVYEFCRSGAINDSIEHVKRALRERRDALVEALDRYIGEDASFVAPEGGYFLWVELPRGGRHRAAAGRRLGARSRVREGLGLHARGRAQRPAARVLGGHPRPDRRGHAAPRRGAGRHQGRRPSGSA